MTFFVAMHSSHPAGDPVRFERGPYNRRAGGAELDERQGDVYVADGRIVAVAPTIDRPPGTEVVEGRGGALIPGLWDHHIHLVALAAARQSVPAGPPDVTDLAELADALRRRATTGRGIAPPP